jgi:hypothetical protein
LCVVEFKICNVRPGGFTGFHAFLNVRALRFTEGKLEAAFQSEARRVIGGGGPLGSALRYVAFDFHAECGNKRYHRLSLLWDQVRHAFCFGLVCQQQCRCCGTTTCSFSRF